LLGHEPGHGATGAPVARGAARGVTDRRAPGVTPGAARPASRALKDLGSPEGIVTAPHDILPPLPERRWFSRAVPHNALIAMAVVVAVLLFLALRDEGQVEVPDAVITLRDTQVTLYPQADPDAVWYFSAPRVEYVPERQEATLFDIADGRRTVGGETDFTLDSERVTIDNSDNIRGEAMHAFLVEDEIDLFMEAKGDRLVLIDQS